MRVAIAGLIAALGAGGSHAAEVLVGVAANFAEVVEQMRPGFERSSGHTLVVMGGSTGQLYAQIRRGAPVHVLLAADRATAERLEADGLAVAGTRFTYALGRLALWSRSAGYFDAGAVAVLQTGRFRHLALANPELAPYGAAAREVLRATGTWDSLQSKLVFGQNVAQAHSMIASGNAELGLVALSLLKGPQAIGAGSVWEVPGTLHAPVRQDAVLLRRGAANPAARAFLEALKAPPARVLIESRGYGLE